MRYTKYYAEIVKSSGIPNLPVSGFQKFMNIVHFECKIAELRNAGKLSAKTCEPRKFDMEIFNVGKQLTLITGNLEPKDLLAQLARMEEPLSKRWG